MKAILDNADCLVPIGPNVSAEVRHAQTNICKTETHDPLVSDEVTYIVVIILQVTLTGIIAAVGIVSNTINIVVFIKMGQSDAINISLLGLAIADLFSLVFSFWESVCFNPLFSDSDKVVVFTEIEYITGCWPHVCFTRVASYITAFITLERCLCISLPLKVQSIITTTATKVCIIAIFIIVTATSIPEYYVNQIVWKFYPEKNRTMLGILFIKDRERFESVTFVLNNIILQCLAFISVVVCTIILITQLNRKSKWRQQTAKADNTSMKDKRVIKMISWISGIFIGSNIPSCAVFIAMACTSKLHPTGVNYNMFYIVWSIVYVMEGINSTISIFIYLEMSSKYKYVFCKTFLCRDMRVASLDQNVSQTV